jgi:hypothetical protein
MLNAAAEVVFVNKIQPLQIALTAQSNAVMAATAQANADRLAAQRSEDQYAQEVKGHADDHKADMAAITTLQGQINDANVQIAQLQADKTGRDTTINQLNSNLTLQTASASELSKQVASLRTLNDTLVRRTEDDAHSIADSNNQKDVLQASLNNVTEQLQAAKELNQRLMAKLPPGANVDVAAGGGGANIPTSSNITGTVVEKQVIAGNTYLRVNVGKVDGVNKGTQFNVLSGPNFLGILTVDEADDHNASGKLIGDAAKIGQVRPGDAVKTQLRGS